MGFWDFIKRKKGLLSPKEFDFELYIDEFLSKKPLALSPKVSTNAGFILKTLFSSYKGNPNGKLSKTEMASLFFKLSRRIPINQKAANDILVLMKAFFKFLEEKGLVEEGQVDKLLKENGLELEYGITPKQPIVRTGPKIGRNEPCPCGSKKKYKLCCGR